MLGRSLVINLFNDGVLEERGGIGSGKCGAGSLELALVAGARFIGENSVSSLNIIVKLIIFYTVAASHTK